MVTLAQLQAYYPALLAFEYRGQPRATAQIAAFVEQACTDLILQQIANAYDVDTAVGVQLDVIGQYVGVSRNIGAPTAQPYFSFWSTASARNPALYQGTWNPVTDGPTIPAASGGNTGWWYAASVSGTSTAPIAQAFLAGDIIYSNGTTWIYENADSGNGLTSTTDPTVNTQGIFTSTTSSSQVNTALSDASYRAVIQLKIILNSNDGTLASIVSYIQQFFPGLIRVQDNKDMTMNYTVSPLVPISPALLAIYLPKPMGVGITINNATTTTLLVSDSGAQLVSDTGVSLVAIGT